VDGTGRRLQVRWAGAADRDRRTPRSLHLQRPTHALAVAHRADRARPSRLAGQPAGQVSLQALPVGWWRTDTASGTGETGPGRRVGARGRRPRPRCPARGAGTAVPGPGRGVPVVQADLPSAGVALVRYGDADPERVADQPGYLGLEAACEHPGLTVSYWSDETAARAWTQVAEHRVAQRRGLQSWQVGYRVRVATGRRDDGPAGSELCSAPS